MQIQNLHQPYIFKHNDKVNLIVSEFTNEILEFKYGNEYVKEDYWKLCHLDENYNKTTLSTPNSFIINDVIHHVIAECNGFVYNNKISYIVGIHPKTDYSLFRYFLVVGDIDITTKMVYNVSLLNNVRTGFVKNDVYLYNKNNQILKNNSSIFDLNPYINNVTRIIPVYNKNKIIVTNAYYDLYKSLLIDLDDNDVKIIEVNNDNKIYKSSILMDEETNMIAYTNKIFNGTSKPDFLLNIKENYTLKNF